MSLLEAMVTIHRLTDKAEAAVKNLASLDWKAWLALVDLVYLPLSTMALEAERRSSQLPEKVKEISKWPNRQQQLSILLGQILSPGAKLLSQINAPGGALLSQYQPPSRYASGLAFANGIFWCGDGTGRIFTLRFP